MLSIFVHMLCTETYKIHRFFNSHMLHASRDGKAQTCTYTRPDKVRRMQMYISLYAQHFRAYAVHRNLQNSQIFQFTHASCKPKWESTNLHIFTSGQSKKDGNVDFFNRKKWEFFLNILITNTTVVFGENQLQIQVFIYHLKKRRLPRKLV